MSSVRVSDTVTTAICSGTNSFWGLFPLMGSMHKDQGMAVTAGILVFSGMGLMKTDEIIEQNRNDGREYLSRM